MSASTSVINHSDKCTGKNIKMLILATKKKDFTKYMATFQSELLGQFRLIGDRASDVSGGRICLTQNNYAEI